MIKKVIGIVVLLILTSVLPESQALANSSLPETTQLEATVVSGSSKGKRKLKKTVRKAARVYRKLTDNRESKKKSRKVQRKVRSLINIF